MLQIVLVALRYSPAAVVRIFRIVVSANLGIFAQPELFMFIRKPLQHRYPQTLPLGMFHVVRQLVNRVILDDYGGVHHCRNLFVVSTQSQHALANQIEPLRALCWTQCGNVRLWVVNDYEIRPLFCAVRSFVCHAANTPGQSACSHNRSAAGCPFAVLRFD